MRASELRIGNYYIHGNAFVYLKGQIGKIDVRDFTEAQDYNPMKITNEDWQSIGRVHNILCDASGFVIFKNSYAYQFIYADYSNWHEIQNLYFALTQEELIIK